MKNETNKAPRILFGCQFVELAFSLQKNTSIFFGCWPNSREPHRRYVLYFFKNMQYYCSNKTLFFGHFSSKSLSPPRLNFIISLPKGCLKQTKTQGEPFLQFRHQTPNMNFSRSRKNVFEKKCALIFFESRLKKIRVTLKRKFAYVNLIV